jgi:hypothetical protein
VRGEWKEVGFGRRIGEDNRGMKETRISLEKWSISTSADLMFSTVVIQCDFFVNFLVVEGRC